MANFWKFRDFQVQLIVLFFVPFQEVFKILVDTMQKTIDFLGGRSHTELSVFDLLGHF